MPLFRRAAARLLALAGWLASGGVLLASLFWGLGLRCDEACDGDGWRRSTDAWQWNGLAALGVLVFLAGTALLVFVWTGRRAGASGAFLGGLGAALGLAFAFSPQWPEHFDVLEGANVLLVLAGVAAPVAAILLTEPRRGSTSTR